MSTAMNWKQLLSDIRFTHEENGDIMPTESKQLADPFRSAFHADYDRVVFSNAFRRLGRKTQVHPLAQNDHTHNRLTHSVEVASVGRSLGNRVAGILANSDLLPQEIDFYHIGTIVQVACLAHDLGNPPFGHTGEDALREWFRQPEHARLLQPLTEAERNDVQTYEGNAHSLRQIARLEMYRNRGGMRLTAASVGALLKYPWSSSHPHGRKKFNIYQSELPYIRRVAETLGLPETDTDCWARHPLSYLMEAADDICYALMDLEDAIGLGLLDYREVEKVLSPLADTAAAWHIPHPRERTAMLRGLAIGKAVDDVAHTFVRHHHDLLNGCLKGRDLVDLCSENVRAALHNAKTLARERIFRHRSKLVHELAAFPCLGLMLDLLVPAAHALLVSGSLNVRQSLALELLEDEPLTRDDTLYDAYMKILDFVGGMTDNYAAKMAQELSGISMV